MTQLFQRLLIVILLFVGTGCATAQKEPNVDPFEGVNRVMFAFNDNMDKHLLAPTARGYKRITPQFMRHGIRNFFANLYDINGMLNATMQGRFPEVARNGGRFVVNTTVGMLGFVDVATEMGIQPYRTDFGHTLSLWGVAAGPYVMVPFFGPRTVRSATGTVFDTVASVQWQMARKTALTLFALEIIDNRAALTAAEDLITGDRYLFVRDAYLQQRQYFINDGVVDDTFSDYEEEFEWDD
jgi:phospholipid-binding lipoprotein MlaA